MSLLAVCLVAMVAMAQGGSVKIKGVVSDEAGHPIEFATVRIVGTAVGTNTSEKGTYELSVARADTIMVEFSMIGYSTVRRQLLKPEGTITISPKLYEKSQELTEVQVTEYRKQAEAIRKICPTAADCGNLIEEDKQKEFIIIFRIDF